MFLSSPNCGIKKSERVVSRVLSSRFPGSDDHLSGSRIASGHERPTRKSRTGRPYPRKRGALPYVALLQAGFSKHPRSPGGLVSSYLTVSPLPASRRLAGGLLFCGTVHGVAPCPVSGPPCPAELGLSSPPDVVGKSDHLTRSEIKEQKSEVRSQKTEKNSITVFC